MNHDRRVLVTASLGLAGLGLASTHTAHAGNRSKATPHSPARSDGSLRPLGNGADDTPSLQAAIDKAADTGEPVLLGPGRYLIRGIALRPRVRLFGTGSSTVLVQTSRKPVISGQALDATAIEDLAIEGMQPQASNARGLIEIQASRDLQIRNVSIRNSAAHAMFLERCGGIVSNCRIAGAAQAAIFSIDARGGLEISHNTISDCGNNGILVWRSNIGEDTTLVAMNRIDRIAAKDGGTGQNGNGINVFRANGVIVTSNRISDCAFSAVRANSASNIQILSNSVARMGEVALYAEFAFEGAVISANLVDGAATGISVTNFDHGGRLAVIQGNLIRNLAFHKGASEPGGYGISVEADASVTGNTIENAPAAGIQIGWGRFCRDLAVTGNVVRNCPIGIAVAGDAKAGSALIATNMISGASRGAIRAMDHAVPLGGDLAVSPPSTGRIRAVGNVVA